MGLAILVQACVLSAAPAGMPHARVTLVSEQTSIQPGATLRVGLRFELEKGWHIYWLNPGDSGEPPRVEWKLPAQFRAGPLEWPAPKRLENGPLVDYGYEGEVLLTAAIRTPARPKPGGTVELQANVRWLVCHDACIPERQTVSLTLPVARDAPTIDSRWRGLFAHTHSRLPKRAPSSWRVSAVSNPESFVLSIETGTQESTATFFPLVPLQIKDSAPQQAAPLAQGIRLTLRKSDKLLRPVDSLRGIVVLGPDRAYSVNVRLD